MKQTAPGKLEEVCEDEEYWEEVGGSGSGSGSTSGSGSGSSSGSGSGSGNVDLSHYQTEALRLLMQNSKRWALLAAGWKESEPRWIPRDDLPEKGFWRIVYIAPDDRRFTNLDEAYEYYLELMRRDSIRGSSGGSSGGGGSSFTGGSPTFDEVVAAAKQELTKRVEQYTGEPVRSGDELTWKTEKLIKAEKEAQARAEDIAKKMQQAYEENIRMFAESQKFQQEQLAKMNLNLITLGKMALEADIRYFSIGTGMPEKVVWESGIWKQFGSASYFSQYARAVTEAYKTGTSQFYVPQLGIVKLTMEQRPVQYETFVVPKSTTPAIFPTPGTSILGPGGLPYRPTEEKGPSIFPTLGSSILGAGGLPTQLFKLEPYAYEAGSIQDALTKWAHSTTIWLAEKYPFYGVAESVRRTITGEKDATPLSWVRERVGNVAGGFIEAPPAILGTGAQALAFTGIVATEMAGSGKLSPQTEYRLGFAKDVVIETFSKPEIYAEAAITAGVFYAGGKTYRFLTEEKLIPKEARQIAVVETMKEGKPIFSIPAFPKPFAELSNLPSKIFMQRGKAAADAKVATEYTGKVWFEVKFEKQPSVIGRIAEGAKALFQREALPSKTAPEVPPAPTAVGFAEFKSVVFNKEIPIITEAFNLKMAGSITEAVGWMKYGGRQIPFKIIEYGKEKAAFVGEEPSVVFSQRAIAGRTAMNPENLPSVNLKNTPEFKPPTKINLQLGYSEMSSIFGKQFGRGFSFQLFARETKAGRFTFHIGETETPRMAPIPTQTLVFERIGKPVRSLEQLWTELFTKKVEPVETAGGAGAGRGRFFASLESSKLMLHPVGRVPLPPAAAFIKPTPSPPVSPPFPTGGAIFFGGGLWAMQVQKTAPKPETGTTPTQQTTAPSGSGSQFVVFKQKSAGETKSGAKSETKTEEPKTETKIKIEPQVHMKNIVKPPTIQEPSQGVRVFNSEEFLRSLRERFFDGVRGRLRLGVGGAASGRTETYTITLDRTIEKAHLKTIQTIMVGARTRTDVIGIFKSPTKTMTDFSRPPPPPPPQEFVPPPPPPPKPWLFIFPFDRQHTEYRRTQETRWDVSGKYQPSFAAVGLGIRGKVGFSEKFGFALRPLPRDKK